MQVLVPKLLEVEGVQVEDNKYALSVHTRNVSAADLPRVELLVEATLEDQPLLKRTEGLRVIELRPQVFTPTDCPIPSSFAIAGFDGRAVLELTFRWRLHHRCTGTRAVPWSGYSRTCASRWDCHREPRREMRPSCRSTSVMMFRMRMRNQRRFQSAPSQSPTSPTTHCGCHRFRELRYGRGLPIIVREKAPLRNETAAELWLRDPREVAEFLSLFLTQRQLVHLDDD